MDEFLSHDSKALITGNVLLGKWSEKRRSTPSWAGCNHDTEATRERALKGKWNQCRWRWEHFALTELQNGRDDKYQ